MIQAKPHPGYNGQYSGLLKNLEGTLWIDKADYHWAKVAAHALNDFSMGLFLARIGKDTDILVEEQLVNGEVWLPKRIQMRASVRLALVKKIHGRQDSQFSDYRKYHSDSRIVSTEP